MSPTFGYRNKIAPEHWGSLNPAWSVCTNGKYQSPIDLCRDITEYSRDLKVLTYDWSKDDDVKIVNNGISPTFHVTPNKHFLRGGPLLEEYEMVQFHIHFSHSTEKGSEHAIDGKYYAAEIHFVHYKKSYGSFEKAVTHRDGLAVVGGLIGVDDNSSQNLSMSDDFNRLVAIADVGSEQKISIDLSAYHVASREFYTYSGSLTTPGCNECVVWLVLRDPLWIATSAYEALKSLKSREGGLMAEPGNYRPVQPLNDRKVYSSFDIDKIDT